MIGGDDMYMPLCRECHTRETNLNKDNAYAGDPSVISARLENERFAREAAHKKMNTSGKPSAKLSAMSDNSTGAISNDSPKAKSFTSDYSEEGLPLRNNIEHTTHSDADSETNTPDRELETQELKHEVVAHAQSSNLSF